MKTLRKTAATTLEEIQVAKLAEEAVNTQKASKPLSELCRFIVNLFIS